MNRQQFESCLGMWTKEQKAVQKKNEGTKEEEKEQPAHVLW